MNIFFLDYDPAQCARWMVDSHVSKMILETAQLLSTAHHVHNSSPSILAHIYKPTHQNHPSAVWARESTSNYYWLVQHWQALAGEFMYRFRGTHKSYISLCDLLCDPPAALTRYGLTVPPACIDDQYKVNSGACWADLVLSYRNYYNLGKRDLHKWRTPESKPNWITRHES